tara:strand:- start:289 stop:855 length:567 start_codon:yes stop_codon:yes gene_type:complete
MSLSHIVGQDSGISNLLKVDSNGKLGVNDSLAQSSLSSISSTLSSSLNVNDSTSQSSLSTISSTLAGTLQVASASTLSVSAPALSTTSSSLASSDSVTDSSTFTSASTDLNAVKDFVVLGSSSDTSAQIKVEVSVDNSNWLASDETPIYSNNGIFVSHQSSQARWVRFTYTNSSGSPKTITMDISYKV